MDFFQKCWILNTKLKTTNQFLLPNFSVHLHKTLKRIHRTPQKYLIIHSEPIWMSLTCVYEIIPFPVKKTSLIRFKQITNPDMLRAHTFHTFSSVEMWSLLTSVNDILRRSIVKMQYGLLCLIFFRLEWFRWENVQHSTAHKQSVHGGRL